MAAATLTLCQGAFAVADWDADQELDIRGNSHSQVLFYDYLTQTATASEVGFGDWEVRDFIIRDNNWAGAFLYDYALGGYVTALWAMSDTF